MHVFTREQVRAVDRLAVERYGVPSIVLMENAARGLADATLHFLTARARNQGMEPQKPRVLVIAGGGNNGGDGFAAARHLHNEGAACTIAVTRPLDDYKGDARTNLDIIRAMKLNILDASADPLSVLEKLEDHTVILDGLFGTGLTAPPRPPADGVIRWMNGRHEPIVAIDIPSGLDCDTGEPLGVAVRAAMTATFVGMKRGFLQPQARAYTGQVLVVDIGVPRELAEQLGGAGNTGA